MVQSQLLQSVWPPVKTVYKDHHGFYHATHLQTAKNLHRQLKTYLFPSVQGGPLKQNLVHLGLSQHPLRDVPRHSPGKNWRTFYRSTIDMNLLLLR